MESCRVSVQEAATGTGWINSEVSDVHQHAKLGSRIVDELILGRPPLGWAGFGSRYMLASGSPCAPSG